MKRKATLMLTALIVLAVALALNRETTQAQSGGGYDLTWNTMDGGGGIFSTGGTYSLGGTIGQMDAGNMGGGAYILNVGFWVDILGNRLNLPLIIR